MILITTSHHDNNIGSKNNLEEAQLNLLNPTIKKKNVHVTLNKSPVIDNR
jgi:hypothetical protein